MRATRTERAGEAARESACRGVRGATPLGVKRSNGGFDDIHQKLLTALEARAN